MTSMMSTAPRFSGPRGKTTLCTTRPASRTAWTKRNRTIAMEILAESAVQNVFTPDARRCLATKYSALFDDAPDRIADTLELLTYDGYLESRCDGHRFPSRLLKDWWAARFRDHPALSLTS